MSEKEVVEIVGRYLKNRHPGGVTLEALFEGIRHEQDWWYVPVRPSQEPARRYEYYEALSDVETELEDAEHLTVLLLPVASEDEETQVLGVQNKTEGWPSDVPREATSYNANRFKFNDHWYSRHPARRSGHRGGPGTAVE